MDELSLGILSDTHLTDPYQAEEICSRLLRGPFADVDVILHAGDLVEPLFGELFGPRPFFAVCGNLDLPRLDLPQRRDLELASWRIGLIHGWGAPEEVPDHVVQEFQPALPDLLVFGHSHQPLCRWVGASLVFNPGSVTRPRGQVRRGSVGLVRLGKKIDAQHIYL